MKRIRWILVFVLVFSLFTVASFSKEEYNFDLMKEAIKIIKNKYIEKNVKEQNLLKGALEGLVNSLDDPYSYYEDPESLKREEEDLLKGEFGGLGIWITIKDGVLTIISPIEDTPAYKAGVKAGDQIVEIDGESTSGITLREAVNKLRGKKGTKVTLTIRRKGLSKNIKITIVRDIIKVESVKSKIFYGDIGYLRLTSFNGKTYKDMKKALRKFKNKGIKGIILDLRNNPGGLLAVAVDVAGEFLPDKKIVYIVDRNGKKRALWSGDGDFPDIPLVVLVNKGSASASEIVSGAIKDYKRGLLIGQKTFGKGLVQNVFMLSNGGALHLTIARYLTPSGAYIHKKGIEPDIVVKEEEGEREAHGESARSEVSINDRVLVKAIEVIKSEINKSKNSPEGK